MPDQPLGSIWTVAGIPDGLVVVLVGPFNAAEGLAEYLVAPLYRGSEAGFRQTDEDVRLEAHETGLGVVSYAGVWNTTPILERDLVVQVGLLPADATRATRDVYWATLNRTGALKGARVGKPIRSMEEPVAAFQSLERDRWQELAGRVFSEAEAASRGPVFESPVISVPLAAGVYIDPADLEMIATTRDGVGLVGPGAMVAGSYRFTATMGQLPLWAGNWQQYEHLFGQAHLKPVTNPVQSSTPVTASADYALAA